MNGANEVPNIIACGQTLEYAAEHDSMRPNIETCDRILSRSLSLMTNKICRPGRMIGS